MEETNVTVAKHEKISNLVVFSELWPIENGLLTTTMKVRRRSIAKSLTQSMKNGIMKTR